MGREDIMSTDTSIVNYVVTTKGFSGTKVTYCTTEEQVYKALSNCSIGALASVTSPTGKSVTNFVPY